MIALPHPNTDYTVRIVSAKVKLSSLSPAPLHTRNHPTLNEYSDLPLCPSHFKEAKYIRFQKVVLKRSFRLP